MIRINISAIPVNDQAKAEAFYVDMFGFRKSMTVENPDGSGVELLLEPAGFDFAQDYQKALYDKGIPVTSFGSDDIDGDCERLKGLGVVIRTPPTPDAGAAVRTALLEDGCGNLIMLVQTS